MTGESVTHNLRESQVLLRRGHGDRNRRKGRDRPEVRDGWGQGSGPWTRSAIPPQPLLQAVEKHQPGRALIDQSSKSKSGVRSSSADRLRETEGGRYVPDVKGAP